MNGGTACYVQYSTVLVPSGSFGSAQLFNDFADNDVQDRGGTASSVGIDEGTRLLGVNPATASFMIVITDGQSSSITATTAAADAARAENIVVFAVGVGEFAASNGRSCFYCVCGIVVSTLSPARVFVAMSFNLCAS